MINLGKAYLFIIFLFLMGISGCNKNEENKEENECKLFGYYDGYIKKGDFKELLYQGNFYIGIPKVDNYVSIEGDSMYPNIKEKDMIFLIKYKSRSQLHICDVIAFKNNKMNRNILHRIIEIKEDYVISRGDNNIRINSVNGEKINETNFENFGYEKVYYQNISHVAVGLLRS